MSTVLIVGLPKSLRKRLESAFTHHKLYIKSILSDIGNKGNFVLLPVGQDPIHAFNSYLDSIEPAQAKIIIVPYADIPQNLINDISAAEELGATVFDQRDLEWPKLAKKQRPDTTFYNKVFDLICNACLPISTDHISVSDYFISTATQNNRLLIHDNVFKICDNVAAHRIKFLKDSIDAISSLISTTLEYRVDEYFSRLGIEHAQSGGISIKLQILDHLGSILRQEDDINTHVKKGDRTSKYSAVRLYYHMFDIQDLRFAAILYAGPHPDDNISCSIRLPQLN